MALFGFLLIGATGVAAAEPTYLAEIPTPEQVIAKVTGQDAFDTSARQDATFIVLIKIMAGMQGVNRTDFGGDSIALKEDGVHDRYDRPPKLSSLSA
jgi:hypothetical protein